MTDKSLRSGERFVAETIEKIAAMDPKHVERYEAAGDAIPGPVVADIGCGVGYGSRILSDAGKIVTGIDDSAETIGYAERHYPGPRYIVADGTAWLSAQDGLDAVVCFDALEHMGNPHAFLAAAYGALRRGGRLFVSVPTEKVGRIVRNPHHDTHYTSRKLLSLCVPLFSVYELKHQHRHLGTGRWNPDCGLWAILEKDQ